MAFAQYNLCCSCRRTCAETSADSLELIRQGLKKMEQRTRVYCHSFHLSAFRARQVAVRKCGAGRDKRKVNHNDGRTRIRMIRQRSGGGEKEKDLEST